MTFLGRFSKSLKKWPVFGCFWVKELLSETLIFCVMTPNFFSANIFKKISSPELYCWNFSILIFFTNITVEWQKFALFYMSFWPVLDRELAAGVTPVTTENLWKGWFLGVPKGSRYNTSPSGWFTECIYSDWFHKSWLPTVQRRPGKHVLIGDNLSSHISVRDQHIHSMQSLLCENLVNMLKTSVSDPWHFGVDPDPRIHASD